MPKVGIIREEKNPPDERVPFSPEQCVEILQKFPDVNLQVRSSNVRRFQNIQYQNLDIEVTEDVSHSDVLFGVKEVPIDSLIPNKTYFFFSHTIKKQPYNRKLLNAVLDKNIRLIDYECLVGLDGKRIVGFGRYAGIVGTYNALLAYGLKHKKYTLKPAYKCNDYQEVKQELQKVNLENIKIVITGRGRVATGAMEILDFIGIEQVSVHDYLTKNFKHPVYVQLAVTDYNRRKDGERLGVKDFFKNYAEYKSDFMRFAAVSDMYVACHFWKEGSPFIFTRDDAKLPSYKIELVADISCDIDGPVASTLRPSTIKNPLYGYDAESETEVEFDAPNAITVMAVDNLPCELPKDASTDFGRELINKVLPELFNGDANKIIANATITENGKLTSKYAYLQDYADGKE